MMGIRFVKPFLKRERRPPTSAVCAARISLSRRSLGEGGCSMKITEDIRKYAAEHGITDAEAVESGMEEKRKEFVEKGSQVYAKK